MRVNATKQKLSEGKVVLGVIIGEYAPVTLEVAGAIGFDFVMIDCEHGPMGLGEVENLVRAAESFDITPLARVPDHEPATILRFLDRGVQGVIVPHVNTREQALTVARAAKYFPDGERSIGSTRAHDYNVSASRADSTRWLNQQTMVLPMIEHVDAVANLDDILSVPGIDVVHIAANDLAQSMGFPPEPEVRAVILDTIGRAKAAGVAAGVGGNNPADATAVAELVKAGATFVTVSATGLLRVGADLFRGRLEDALKD
jgi:4-hydroxy-2-oxoheptanedioate aldolase